MPKRWDLYLFWLIFIAFASSSSFGQESTFDRATARTGHQLYQGDCRWPDTSVWVEYKGRGDCIRYFHAGLSKGVGAAHIFIHGDVNLKRYRASQGRVQSRVDREQEELGLPNIWLSRPGLFGSTGHYRQYRKTLREAALVNSAIDAIKEKYRIVRFHLLGQSSGGRLVAILLSMRNDIGCAISASGGLAQKMFTKMKGRKWKKRFVDPMDRVASIPSMATRRVFIVGDDWDRVVPFEIQTAYHAALTRAGHHALLIKATGRGKGPRYHQLAYAALDVVKWCDDGVADKEILARVNDIPIRN